MTTRLEPVDQPAMLASVMLYWLPLGAGGHSARWNGRIFEALVARHERRAVRDLYHSALEVHIGADSYIIEMTPCGLTGRWTAASCEKGRWDPVCLVGPHCFGTRFDDGTTAPSRTWRMPLPPPNDSAKISPAPDGCWNSCRRCPL